jgi:putative FmdB family regulatory protein
VPTYQYACTACDERLEVVQKFTDEPLTECGSCGGRLRKVFSPVGIVFKGSGFYRTDSRASSNGANSGDKTESKKSEEKSGASSGSDAGGDSSSSKSGDQAKSNSSQGSRSQSGKKGSEKVA